LTCDTKIISRRDFVSVTYLCARDVPDCLSWTRIPLGGPAITAIRTARFFIGMILASVRKPPAEAGLPPKAAQGWLMVLKRVEMALSLCNQQQTMETGATPTKRVSALAERRRLFAI
jgi:hypothetical protein